MANGDPRLAGVAGIQPAPVDPRLWQAKRPRLDAGSLPGGLPTGGGVPPPPPAALPPVIDLEAPVEAAPPSALAEAELSSRIWASLKRLAPVQAPPQPALRVPTAAQYESVSAALIAPKIEPKTEPGLGDMLLNSLRSLSSESAEALRVVQEVQPRHASFMPVKHETSVKQESSVKQELGQPGPQTAMPALPMVPAEPAGARAADPRLEARQAESRAVKEEVKREEGTPHQVVKQETASQAVLKKQPAKKELVKKPTLPEVVDLEADDRNVMTEAELLAYPGDERLPPANLGVPAPERPPLDFDDDDDNEGVPHRLPPGFGAVPEDVIEARLRQREEEKIRRIKATQPCRFGTSCKKRDCMNMHPEGRSIDTNLNPCAFGRRCKRHNCFYDHPEGRLIDDDPTRGMCKLGARCKRADCLYTHPPGRDVPVGSVQVCFFCHEMGHIAQDCPRNPGSWTFGRQGQLVALQPGVEAAPAIAPGSAV